MWEIIEYCDQKTQKHVNSNDYDSLLRKVAWFDNAISFFQAWNRVPHAKISDVLLDVEKNQFKM